MLPQHRLRRCATHAIAVEFGVVSQLNQAFFTWMVDANDPKDRGACVGGIHREFVGCFLRGR